MATADRVLSILGLFSIDRPEWTVDEIIGALGLSGSTAYLYVRSLVSAGLLVAGKSGRYTVGPAVIELDRITRRFDPLIGAAQQTLRDLTDAADVPSIGLLCRLYRHTVICVDQFSMRAPDLSTSYERGRPMPLVRGSASKIILAHLPYRSLRRFHDSNLQAIELAGLGADWDSFKKALRVIRKPGVLITKGELDPGLVGISAPVFDADGVILGSIGLVLRAQSLADDAERQAELQRAVKQAGETVSSNLQG